MEETFNARIASTIIGPEDHNIFTVWLFLDYDAGSQGFGGYCFDEWDKELKRRVERTGLFCEYVKAVLRVTGVSQWEKLSGTVVRIRRDNHKLVAIGNIIKDDWFYPDQLFGVKN